VLDGASPGPTVLLRGDMDALPLREDTGLEFASQVEGASPVGAAFALHISTQYESGTLNLRPGPTMASGDRIEMVVHGRSGPASAPYRSLDPVPIACEIVQALQVLVTRKVDVFDPAVITIARIAAGTTHNIIPETAEMSGTMQRRSCSATSPPSWSAPNGSGPCPTR
jgi:metal-dependent amidase/aminoacylase/carboxypeptidase family protein